MANLGRDRGQIILVAAFALAVIFVTLALIVNSAIFTQNLASRGETAGSDGALSMREMVETNVGDAVESANWNNNSSETNLEDAVNSSIRELTNQTGYQQAQSGRLVDVGDIEHHSGRRIYKTGGGDLQSDGNADYDVADGIERMPGGNGTRAFRIEATSISVDVDDGDSNDSAFTVEVTEPFGNVWRSQIYRNGDDTVHVRTFRTDSTGTGTVREDCEVTRDESSVPFRIDVTGGTINGDACDALGTGPDGNQFQFGATVDDPYNVDFENANTISGEFSMIVYDDGGLSLSSLLSSGSPYETDALYGVTVRYSYQTSELTYETDVRVAPGEPDA